WERKLTRDITNRWTYTRLKAEDMTTGNRLVNRPEDTLTFNLNRDITENNTNLDLVVRYTGKRYDDADNTIELSGYTTADLTISKKADNHSGYFIKLANFTGKDDIDDEYDINGSEFSFGYTQEF
ncbi:MAG: TonB-dependent receptor domain-containing protein, partial [Candidatus Muiribacteriaceae bacterium]